MIDEAKKLCIMRTSLTQSVDEKLKRKKFSTQLFNNLTTDKCGCLWFWASLLRRNLLVHVTFKSRLNLTRLFGLSKASEKTSAYT